MCACDLEEDQEIIQKIDKALKDFPDCPEFYYLKYAAFFAREKFLTRDQQG